MKEINVSINYIIRVPETVSVREVAQEAIEDAFKFTSFWLDGRELVVKAEHASFPFERCTIRNTEIKR